MSVRTRLLVPLAIWMALGTWAADPLLAQVRLQGRVLDDVIGQPLQGARVLLLKLGSTADVSRTSCSPAATCSMASWMTAAI